MKEGGSVGFGGNQKGKIIGTGTVGNSSLSINDVWLVDGLKHNLLSISQFCDNGYVVVFNKESCTVSKQSDKSMVFKGLRKNNVYKINLSDLNEQKVLCLLTLSEEKWIWHKRLGHANWRLISKLSKLDLVRGLPKIKYHSNTLCGSCQKGKITKSSFKPKNIVSTSRPLELLHIDLFGPVHTASINGKKYGLVIVDDYSRWTWVKFLRTKDEAYDEFSIFCKQIQNEKGYTILKVRSDHGGEFENEPFENFCEKYGILHEFSSPRTPQQNGVVERKNRTLQEMARTMMHETNVAKFLWAEAVNTACYVQNRIYIRSKLNKTAYELFKGRKPDISYFHQFGCTCYILNNKVHLKKFDARGYKGIFIGYSERSKAYRLYISETHTVEETMHVKFDDKEPDQVSELVEGLSRFQVSEDQYSDIPDYSEHPFSEEPLNITVPTDSEQQRTEATAEPDYMRIRVKVDVRLPLKKDTKVKNKAGEWCTVNFKYEKLGVFCFVCGIMGHAENKCGVRFAMEHDDGTRGWSSDIRAEPKRQGGRLSSRWLREDRCGREEQGGGERVAQPNFPPENLNMDPSAADVAMNFSTESPNSIQPVIMTRQSQSMPNNNSQANQLASTNVKYPQPLHHMSKSPTINSLTSQNQTVPIPALTGADNLNYLWPNL
ncbi:unnamed protein product [Trifolium pratense]|uniref:Uncharacterized protein n=1 Tax=Trifolium pratense TaxID=57577 RepID=A0ACB0JNM6_TRIPR|nr:unnamed protein product [Trifolium pratense]